SPLTPPYLRPVASEGRDGLGLRLDILQRASEPLAAGNRQKKKAGERVAPRPVADAELDQVPIPITTPRRTDRPGAARTARRNATSACLGSVCRPRLASGQSPAVRDRRRVPFGCVR